MALLLECNRPASPERRERRKDVAKLGLSILIERSQYLLVNAGQVFVQCVEERRERVVALELGRCPGQDQVTALVGPSLELLQQPRLADARLTRNRRHAGPRGADLVQDALNYRQLGGPPHQVSCQWSHKTLRHLLNAEIRVRVRVNTRCFSG